MKIICKKSELLSGVSISLRAVPQKSTMPILECIVIDVTDDKIKLISNDLELSIETLVAGMILETGSIALNAKIFSDIVRKLPDNDVTIETDDKYQATITCEKANFKISGKSNDEFPMLPQFEKREAVMISQFSLKEIIRQTVFSIADNESNKLMTGELFEIDGSEFSVTSLDGHRVSIRKIKLNGEYQPIKVVIPGKTLNEISKILSGETEEKIQMYFTEKHVLFEFDNTIVLSRLIEGEYYKISQMLSGDYETKITVNKREFLDCIDRATLMIKESEKKPIIIEIENNNMELKINSMIGSMKEDIDVKQEGKDILIGFNPKFLMDALRVIDDEEVSVYMTNPKAPCFIKNAEESYVYLILPVNFSRV